jgi:hypothetical protein
MPQHSERTPGLRRGKGFGSPPASGPDERFFPLLVTVRMPKGG